MMLIVLSPSPVFSQCLDIAFNKEGSDLVGEVHEKQAEQEVSLTFG